MKSEERRVGNQKWWESRKEQPQLVGQAGRLSRRGAYCMYAYASLSYSKSG
jgi:hypothetical protein